MSPHALLTRPTSCGRSCLAPHGPALALVHAHGKAAPHGAPQSARSIALGQGQFDAPQPTSLPVPSTLALSPSCPTGAPPPPALARLQSKPARNSLPPLSSPPRPPPFWARRRVQAKSDVASAQRQLQVSFELQAHHRPCARPPLPCHTCTYIHATACHHQRWQPRQCDPPCEATKPAGSALSPALLRSSFRTPYTVVSTHHQQGRHALVDLVCSGSSMLLIQWQLYSAPAWPTKRAATMHDC